MNGFIRREAALPIEAERRALSSPAEAERIITRMTEMEDRVRQLRSGSERLHHPWGGSSDALTAPIHGGLLHNGGGQSGAI